MELVHIQGFVRRQTAPARSRAPGNLRRGL